MNRRIIKPAVKEINDHSDIFLTVETQRQGRKVTGIQFLVEENPNQLQMKIPGVEDEMDFSEASESPVVKKCVEIGIGDGVAIQWLKAYGEAYLLEKIQMAEEKKRNGTIRQSLTGWLVRAVKENYQDEAAVQREAVLQKREAARLERQSEAEASERALEQQQKERLAAREAVKRYLEGLSAEALHERQSAYVTATSERLEPVEGFEDWVAEQEGLGNPYPAMRVKRMMRSVA